MIILKYAIVLCGPVCLLPETLSRPPTISTSASIFVLVVNCLTGYVLKAIIMKRKLPEHLPRLILTQFQ
jgi:hypothetical protein